MSLEIIREYSFCVLLDVLECMLRESNKILSSYNVDRVVGAYEWLPFRDNSFSLITAAFSLRDSWSLPKTLFETRRALCDDGMLLALDLGKPTSRIKRLLVTIYWRIFAKLLLLTLGPLAKYYSRIEDTYLALPRNSFLKKLFLRVFCRVKLIEVLGGAVVTLLAWAGGGIEHERR